MRTPNFSYYVEVFAAAERIVLRSGCGAATVRAVATEGGLSPSTVRHHYRNQSHLAGLRVRRGRGPLRPRAGWTFARSVRDEDADGRRTPSTSWRPTCRPTATGSTGSGCCTPTRRGPGTTGTWRSCGGLRPSGCSSCACGVCLGLGLHPRCRPCGRPASCGRSSPVWRRRSSPSPRPPEGEPASACRPAHRPRRASRSSPSTSDAMRVDRSRSTGRAGRSTGGRPTGRQSRLTIANLTA